MHPAYLETRFRTDSQPDHWPPAFAIITAFATTGETWSPEQNAAADQALESRLRGTATWLHRLTGYSPSTAHAEPGWAAAISWNDACNLGLEFLQDALYWVDQNQLSVTFCDHRRQPIPVAPFSERLD